MLRIGLLLCGCGHLDGSDPLQTIALRIAAARAGDLLFPLAPDREQADVIGLQGPSSGPPRNTLAESARLTGGRIDTLDGACADEFDVLAVVGGLGVLKSLEGESSSMGAALVRGVLAQRGALLLFDEGVAWAARAVSPSSCDEVGKNTGWQLAAGNDRLLQSLIAAAGHEPIPQLATWVEDRHATVFSIVLAAESPADQVLDACTSGIECARRRLHGFAVPEDQDL